MNHNKKRNTAFLYEILLREGTKATLEKKINTAKVIKNIIFQHFNSSTEIYKELQLYNSLKESIVEKEYAEKYLNEVKNRYEKINKTKLFNEQTNLINNINKQIGPYIFETFIPEYKYFATIWQIFNSNTKIKEKILLEKNILEKIIILNEDKNKDTLETVDNIVFKAFSKKFNEKYSGLLNEQKQLLSKYINSFSKNSLEFKIYLNEELTRLKETVASCLEVQEIKQDDIMTNKTQETLKFLDSFKEIKDLNQDMLQKILKIQQFVHEVTK